MRAYDLVVEKIFIKCVRLSVLSFRLIERISMDFFWTRDNNIDANLIKFREEKEGEGGGEAGVLIENSTRGIIKFRFEIFSSYCLILHCEMESSCYKGKKKEKKKRTDWT